MSHSRSAPLLIGMLMPWRGVPMHTRVLLGVYRAVRAAGARLVIFHGNTGDRDATRSFDALLNRVVHDDDQVPSSLDRIAGWIITNELAGHRWIDRYLGTGKPAVFISPFGAVDDHGAVFPDNRNGAQAAVAHLIAHGHTRIAFIGHLQNPDIAQRFEGYQQAHDAAGLDLLPDLTVNADQLPNWWSVESGTEATYRLHARGMPCSALFAATDALARGALIAFRRLGLRVPEDIALVGFDDHVESRVSIPPLTTVRQHFVTLGARAVERLLARLSGHEDGAVHAVAPTLLVVRRSCGCPPAYQYVRPAITLQAADPIPALLETLIGTTDTSWEYAGLNLLLEQLITAFRAAVQDDQVSGWMAALETILPMMVHQGVDALRMQSALELLAQSAQPALRAQALLNIGQRAVTELFPRTLDDMQNQWRDAMAVVRDLSVDLAAMDQATMVSLAWMERTSALQAALLLFDSRARLLRVEGVYRRDGASALELGSAWRYQDIPPPPLLDAAQDHLMLIFPVSTRDQAYGVLCLVTDEQGLVQSSNVAAWCSAIAIQLGHIRDLELRNLTLEQFASTVSHDLKSPLVTIAAFAGMLERDLQDGRPDRFTSDLRRVIQAADRMRRMLDDLLALSKAGRQLGTLLAVPLDEIVAEALELVAGRFNACGMHVEVTSNLPLVYVDRRHLVEVIQNLLDNAAKYIGSPPIPLVQIGARTEPDYTLIWVRDNGIGIAAQHLETIFGLFDTPTKRQDSTGLGLALARRIIEVHGGRLWAESDGPGHGSTFYFTLPLAPAVG